MVQLKLETNLPLIFLTLLVISIVVIGFLEFKKIDTRLKTLEYIYSEKKNEINDESLIHKDINIIHETKENNQSNEGKKEKEEIIHEWRENIPPHTPHTPHTSHTPHTPQKDEIINQLMSNEYFEEDNVNAPLEYRTTQSNYIQEIYEENQFDKDDSDLEKLDDDLDNETDPSIDIHSVDNDSVDNNSVDDEDEDENENDDEDEDEDEDITKIIQQKEKEGSNEQLDISVQKQNHEGGGESVLETGQSNTLFDINKSYSVNELKNICKELNLPLSGNKSKLRNRILENQQN